jgi:hypothetical protein
MDTHDRLMPDRKRKVYVADEVELAAIVAAVLKWVHVVPGLPRGNQEERCRQWKIPRADPRSMFEALGDDSEIPASLTCPVGLYERQEIVVFGLRFRVWGKLS